MHTKEKTHIHLPFKSPKRLLTPHKQSNQINAINTRHHTKSTTFY